MKGQVLDYSVHTSSGIISGDDGIRYAFTRSDWKTPDRPARGARVDFEIANNAATAIYPEITPQSARPASSRQTKEKVVAGVLAILLGGLGIHKFYLGYNHIGILYLALFIVGSLLTFGIAGIVLVIIGVVEGITYLTKSDEEFYETYVANQKLWF